MKNLNSKTKRYVPTHEDPIVELRALVRRHAAIVKTSVSLTNQSSDRVIREGDRKGEKIPCSLSEDVAKMVKETAKRASKDAKSLEPLIEKTLRQIPIYTLFLKHVFGMGPVVAGYLVANVKIDLARRPSNLIRYCGNAIDPATGRLERRGGAPKAIGGTGTYNAEIRTRLWQFMCAAMKNSYKHSAKAPHGVSSRYLDAWRGALIGEAERKHAGTQANAKTVPFFKGRMVATDLFLHDLYIVWRSLMGLEVWPSWHSARVTGRRHGDGAPVVNEPEVWTVEQALAFVGDVGSRPLSQPAVPFKELSIISDDPDDIDLAAAAEE